MNKQIRPASEIFHYIVDRKEDKVNQMWIEETEESYDVYKYHAVAFNPRNGEFMVVSNPRGYNETLQWVRKWCNSFCILPV